MNPWLILNIQPNSSIKEIKKAYATLLKTNHPEENPEGYQKLRKAYDLAVKLSKSGTNKSTNGILADTKNLDNEFQSSSSTDTEKTFDYKKDIKNSNNRVFNNDSDFSGEKDTTNSSYKVFNGSTTKDYDDFLLKLDKIYTNPKLRFKKEAWKELFSSPIMWNLQYTNILATDVLKYLSNNYYISEEIWNIINNTFGYNENINFYKHDKLYQSDFTNIILNLNNITSLSCDYLGNIDELSLDAYLSHRYNIYLCINSKDFYEAQEYLSLARSISVDDPELYRLEGDLYFEQRNYEKANLLYNQAFTTKNNDYYLMYRIAQTYCIKRFYKKALPFLEKLPEDYKYLERLMILGHCYYHSRKLKKSKKCFEVLLKLYPKNYYFKEYYINAKWKVLFVLNEIRDTFDYIHPTRYLNIKPLSKIQMIKNSFKRIIRIIREFYFLIIKISILLVILGALIALIFDN